MVQRTQRIAEISGLLIQTAFEQEFAAVKRAGQVIAREPVTTIQIGNRSCALLMTGMGPQAARQATQKCLETIERPSLVVSIGLAGGLRSELKFGDCCLIDKVQSLSNSQPPSDPLWSQKHNLSTNLTASCGLHALVTIPQVAFSSQAKRQLADQCEASLCDMETFAVADVCRQWQLPWVGARIVSDTVDESIQPWIGQLPGLLAERRWLRMFRLIATHPQDLPSLLRLAMRMQKLEKQLSQLTIDLVTNVLPA